MATHSSVLAWRIPGTGKPGGLPSMGSHRVRHDWSDLAAVAAAAVWRIIWSMAKVEAGGIIEDCNINDEVKDFLGEGNGTPLSILAWRIPWLEEPGGLLSMGQHRVGHDWSYLAAAARDFLVVQWLRVCAPNAESPGSILGEGTRSHMPQVRSHMVQWRSHVPQPKKKMKRQWLGLGWEQEREKSSHEGCLQMPVGPIRLTIALNVGCEEKRGKV